MKRPLSVCMSEAQLTVWWSLQNPGLLIQMPGVLLGSWGLLGLSLCQGCWVAVNCRENLG